MIKGEVVYLYAFDVANEIATAKIDEILASRPYPFEIQTNHTFPRDVPLYKPLVIASRALSTTLGGRPVHFLIRVYDVGVVSFAIRVPFETESLTDLLPFHKPVLEDGRTIDQVAKSLCVEVCQSLKDALIQSSPLTDPEAYTAFCLTDLGLNHEASRDVNQWLAQHRRAVAELLTESKSGTLSEMQVNEVLRIQRSYSTADLVVIDWDAALVVEQSGYMDDVLYVLELANLQLEEYRVMDQRLDQYLDRAYEDLKRRRFGLFGTYTARLRMLRVFRVDVTKLNDEVSHISKFFGDWYLARVYLGAAERFYLNQWRQSVGDRLGQLDQLYSVVNSDINNRRMVWLEVLVVIFFAAEILLTILKM